MISSWTVQSSSSWLLFSTAPDRRTGIEWEEESTPINSMIRQFGQLAFLPFLAISFSQCKCFINAIGFHLCSNYLNLQARLIPFSIEERRGRGRKGRGKGEGGTGLKIHRGSPQNANYSIFPPRSPSFLTSRSGCIDLDVGSPRSSLHT